MATPSSSTTTPSPQPIYLQSHTPGAAPPTASTAASNGAVVADKEERDKAVQKFLARAEIGKLTRGLRTRLSYANFKATHNLTRNTLHDLELDAQSQVRVANRASANHHNAAAVAGNSALTPGGSAKTAARKGSMAPPPPVTASAAQSLFASILAPPPPKRARTIHNSEEPPVAAPARPTQPESPSHRGSKAPREGGHPRSKSHKKGGAKGKGRHKEGEDDSEGSAADVDIDMKAAATLTSLLLSSRPSISAAASSPRSSISAGSDSGSTHSYAQYAQSSARTLHATAPMSGESSYSTTQRQARPITPQPPLQGGFRQNLAQPSSVQSEGRGSPKVRKRPIYPAGESGTPHPPSDTEAADSLLFLATSPSPVRASFTRARDTPRTGSNLKGRALFPGQGDGDNNNSHAGGRMPRREETRSWASTTSVGSNDAAPQGSMQRVLANRFTHRPNSAPPAQPSQDVTADHPNVPMEPTITPPTPTIPSTTQLLPPPSTPPRMYASPRPIPSDHPSQPSSQQTPDGKRTANEPEITGNGSFSTSSSVQVSPSSAAAAEALSRLGSAHSGVGRRPFEQHHGANISGMEARKEGANDAAVPSDKNARVDVASTTS
ncbi:uncharacterized protein LAESUDRAFT_717416 [Laetiporus sulphureus 93-53]|uniref:Uncharacterized protein n=1 Tax=Laetiporus sulphureus 93-53 TaxID=1314785 RepID=A0A165BRH6_9APHY|nr:uncharacterized protein LAESUDRAFT_717416 [Laetiporus sulphureus 93-53]KZT01520.1 hypothetical protein LAESUDRAFT_717416 [Laetiporus sulphureus 93-53]